MQYGSVCIILFGSFGQLNIEHTIPKTWTSITLCFPLDFGMPLWGFVSTQPQDAQDPENTVYCKFISQACGGSVMAWTGMFAPGM